MVNETLSATSTASTLLHLVVEDAQHELSSLLVYLDALKDVVVNCVELIEELLVVLDLGFLAHGEVRLEGVVVRARVRCVGLEYLVLTLHAHEVPLAAWLDQQLNQCKHEVLGGDQAAHIQLLRHPIFAKLNGLCELVFLAEARAGEELNDWVG